MTATGWVMTIAILASAVPHARHAAQGAPPASGAVWPPKGVQTLEHDLAVRPQEAVDLVPDKTDTLAELSGLAQRHNPETRVAWQEAKSKAASLGIARSARYPTMSAVALAVTLRTATLIGEYFHRQTEGIFGARVLHVEYLIFDVGGRSGEIDAAKANLLASDFAFNDTHRRIIYQVAAAYTAS